MNIDERLEALAQTVEIMASMQQETERNLQRLGERVDAVTAAVAILVRIVESHERRLDNLDNPGNLPPSPN